MPSVQELRSRFPALQGDIVYLENAGGSQVPQCVADAICRYMTETYVQLGASYSVSVKSTEVVERAHAFASRFMNGEGIGQVVLGPSTTQLVTMLAECYSRRLKPGDEIILCETAHEANAGPWEKLERFGIEIRWWRVDPDTGRADLADLEALFTARTRLVAFPHVSNLLGEVVDVEAITELAHRNGAKVVVDGVAYASHRAIDVRRWNVDWYVYSTYKVFGPHMAVLFGTHEAFSELEGPNHFFLPSGDPYKFELGGANHESCAGLLSLQEYLAFVADSTRPNEGELLDRGWIEAAWTKMQGLEHPLAERLVAHLAGHPRVRVVGPTDRDRVATVSFVHESKSPPEIVAHTDQAGIGIRWGHMYAYRLCKAMGIDTDTGVVRVSAVHYNTIEEIERLIGVLDTVL